jgi:hypothetical protein
MSLKIKYQRRSKVAFVFLLIMLADIILPTTVHALTSGPSQPEVQSFEPMGTTEMVDLFTGDFTYNIPLFELPGPDGGYPFNLSYHGGVGMDQEATWTGLGWNINAGAINRQKRGIPDDFNGDLITRTVDMKPNVTVGLSYSGTDFEGFGFQIPTGSRTIEPYYNSYRGLGIKSTRSYSFQYSDVPGLTLGIGLNISKNSQVGGTDISPSFSLAFSKQVSNMTIAGMGVDFSMNYNTRMGLTDIGLGMNFNVESSIKVTRTDEKTGGKHTFLVPVSSPNLASQTNISLLASEYTPTVTDEMGGSNLHITAKWGVGMSGIYIDKQASGYYNLHRLKHKNKPVTTAAYGYLNTASINDKIIGSEEFDILMDVNRENDGIIHEKTPLLPIPIVANDIYSISGQGVGGQFRSYSGDVDILRDKEITSVIKGGSAGVDIGPGAYGHYGGSGQFTKSTTTNKLGDISGLASLLGYNVENSDPYYEANYFRVSGDMAMEDPYHVDNYMNGIGSPSYFTIKKGAKNFNWQLQNKDNIRYASNHKLTARRNRSANIEGIKNKYIHADDRSLSYLDVKYKKLGETVYNRNVERNNPDHLGGFITFDQNGSRYIYGLPVMNKKDESYTYSVNSSILPYGKVCSNSFDEVPILNGKIDYSTGDKYFEKLELPPYAHAYLLTGIVGPDYVDITNDGITDDDLGYWVKFQYTKTDEAYKWRSPFEGASYIPGQLSSFDDDKGHFTYGERENYYLTSAETKTHIALFEIEERKDGKGAINAITNGNSSASSSYSLKTIEIFSKNERLVNPNALPIKSVHFFYDNSLCKNLPNSSETIGSSESGKLTLKTLHFKFRRNTRGEHNQYHFDYGDDEDFGTALLEHNPDYNPHAYDCWGNYNEWIANNCANSHPYVKQKETDQIVDNDKDAAAWSLKRIKTPSGAIIKVEYEADDYAYVQNKRAMQMYNLSADQGQGQGILSNTDLSILVDVPDEIDEDNKMQLFDYTNQLYFKVLMPLIKNGNRTSHHEYIVGYADIDIQKTKVQGTVVNHKFKIFLKPFKNGSTEHPISTAAFDYLQYVRPEIMPICESGFTANQDVDDTNDEAKSNKFVAMIPTLMNYLLTFGSALDFCSASNEFDIERSFVRLNNTTGFKEGGGHRVKSISMKDVASNDEYGQVYDYTTFDADLGKVVSSGVATYEPNIGGEQNALKKAIIYEQNLTLKSNLRLFSEYPYNESYFPPPSVGYSKVTVTSLNSHKVINDRLNDNINGNELFNDDIAVSTNGTTVHEFYTAKDFPVYIEKSDFLKSDSPIEGTVSTDKHNRPLVFYNSVYDFLAMSQGFLIELNDMHGRQKSVSTYAHSLKGEVEADPYSQVNYYYKSYTDDINNATASRLESKVMAVLPNGSKKEMYWGLDYEFFVDVRTSNSVAKQYGANLNVDMIPLPPFWLTPPGFPIPVGFGVVGKDKKESKFVVTNKIVRKSGILERTEVKYNNSTLVTENLNYDAQTGAPILTKTQNNFNDWVYSYNIPGYWNYGGMAAAYKNLGLKFKGDINYNENTGGFTITPTNFSGAEVVRHLYPGDEFVVEMGGRYKTGYVSNINSNNFELDFDLDKASVLNNQPLSDKEFYLVRSGRRNLLAVTAGTVTALKNPLEANLKNCENE